MATVSKPDLTDYGSEAANPAPSLELEEALKPHSVLFHKETVFPPGLAVNLRSLGEWKLAAGVDAFDMSRGIQALGWHFFFMVPAVSASAFGTDRKSALAKALERLTDKIDAKNLNAVEIEGIRLRHMWGIYRVTIRGYPRHLGTEQILRKPTKRPRRHQVGYAGDFRGIEHRVE